MENYRISKHRNEKFRALAVWIVGKYGTFANNNNNEIRF